MERIIKKSTLGIMAVLFILLPLTVQGETIDEPEQSKIIKVVRLELPPATDNKVPVQTVKSPTSTDETFEQRIMRLGHKADRKSDLNLISASSNCNQDTMPCLSW